MIHSYNKYISELNSFYNCADHLAQTDYYKSILVCGGRDYKNKERLYEVLDSFKHTLEIVEIIHGAAKGADSLAGQWAKSRGIKETPEPANWRPYEDKSIIDYGAGPKRNQKMLAEYYPDIVLAFKGGNGTRDMVKRSDSQGFDVVTVDWVYETQQPFLL